MPGSPEFSIISTPYLGIPFIGTLPTSPLGGTNVAQLNDTAPSGGMTKLSQNFQVNSSNCLFFYAFADVLDVADLFCCNTPELNIYVRDCNGNILPALTQSLSPVGFSCGGNVNYSLTTLTSAYCNWQVRTINLMPYIGSCVTIEVICHDCNDGYHSGYAYFDAYTSGSPIPIGSGLTSSINPVEVCGWSVWNVFNITAPPGFATYTWVCPSGCQGQNQQTLVGSNPLPGTIYTVNATPYSGNVATFTYTLATSQTSISAIGSSPSCPLGSNGSATVLSTGSPQGYSYVWTNALGQVVSTAATASSLAPGIYSVTVNGLCGSASETVAVGTKSNNSYGLNRYFCLNKPVYLTAPTGGNNYQWYDGSSAVSPSLGGTADSFLADSPSLLNFYRVAFTSTTGCRDSVVFLLQPTSPGSLSIVSNPTVCPNVPNVTSVFSLTPAALTNTPWQGNSFYAYTALSTVFSSVTAAPATSFSVSISSGTDYTVTALDGTCLYSVAVSANVYPAGFFNLFVSPNPVLCQGQAVQAQAVFSPAVPPAYQFNFSWSPSQFLSSNNQPFTTITPTAAPGTSSTIVYTVTATNTLGNCAATTKTLSIVSLNLPAPTISSIPALCANAAAYTINATPPGGTFSYNYPQGGFSGPVVVTSFSTTGNYTVSYATLCNAAATASFSIIPQTTITITGNNTVCAGESTTLTAMGAGSYTWSTGISGSSIAPVSTVTTIYTLTGFSVDPACSASASFQVIVHPLPTLSISGNTFICKESLVPLNLSAAGADAFYIWNGEFSGAAITDSPATTSIYSVTGYNNTGCGSSASVTVFVEYCLGLKNITPDGTSAHIYPNPTSGDCWLISYEPVTLTIYDSAGRTVYCERFKSGTSQLHLELLTKGMYSAKLGNDEKTTFQKLIRD